MAMVPPASSDRCSVNVPRLGYTDTACLWSVRTKPRETTDEESTRELPRQTRLGNAWRNGSVGVDGNPPSEKLGQNRPAI
jgi:hypothetical protein